MMMGIRYNPNKPIEWIPMGLGGTPARKPTPLKKIVWKKMSLYWRVRGWAGCFVCENFDFDQYKDMIEWCRESFDDIHIQYGILTEARVDVGWVNVETDDWPDTISLLRIHFKNKEDAVAFKMAWGGEQAPGNTT